MPELDTVYKDHIDRMRALGAEVKDTVEQASSQLSLDDVLRNPEAELMIFSESLAEALIKKFSTRFMAEGVRYAEAVK